MPTYNRKTEILVTGSDMSGYTRTVDQIVGFWILALLRHSNGEHAAAIFLVPRLAEDSEPQKGVIRQGALSLCPLVGTHRSGNRRGDHT